MKTITCHCGNKLIIMDHGLAYISKAMNAAPMVVVDAWGKRWPCTGADTCPAAEHIEGCFATNPDYSR